MKKLITEADVLKISGNGSGVIPVGKNDILTPLARDRITSIGLKIVDRETVDKTNPGKQSDIDPVQSTRVVIASDHTGFKIKSILKQFLSEKNLDVIDAGTFDESSCDYPDFAYAAANKVAMKEAGFGIIIDATGIPSAITANKIPGIRAATCYNEFSARSAREHNNANVLVVGAKALGEETIKSIIDTWLNTEFAGDRHQRRLDKIKNIEQAFLSKGK